MKQTNKKTSRDILFWSGGKDSFLALKYLQDDTKQDPLLLTTFDDESGNVPHQDIPIETIRQQALDLELLLFMVPLSYPATNDVYLEALKKHLETIPFNVDRLVFGDLHLQDIRDWREEQFGNMGYDLAFPIWKKPYQELFDRLEDENVSVKVSAVMDKYSECIEVGESFNRSFADALPKEIDKMGENGEFHTEVKILSKLEV